MSVINVVLWNLNLNLDCSHSTYARTDSFLTHPSPFRTRFCMGNCSNFDHSSPLYKRTYYVNRTPKEWFLNDVTQNKKFEFFLLLPLQSVTSTRTVLNHKACYLFPNKNLIFQNELNFLLFYPEHPDNIQVFPVFYFQLQKKNSGYCNDQCLFI